MRPYSPFRGLGALKNRADGKTAAAEAVVPVLAVRLEVHAVPAVRVVRVERTRPIVAAERVAQAIVDAIARRREKNMVTIGIARYD